MGNNKNQSAETDAEVLQIIDNLTLFDDTLMSKVFDKNIPAATLLLQIILERDDIEVIEVKGQEDLKNPYPKGRNLKLDIHAVDMKGVEFDVDLTASDLKEIEEIYRKARAFIFEEPDFMEV